MFSERWRSCVAVFQADGLPDLSQHIKIPASPTQILAFPLFHGGFSDVYKGVLSLPDRQMDVALKVYRALNDPAKAFKYLQREVCILKAIPPHSNVAELIGVGVIENRPTLVLRWYARGNAWKDLAGKDLNTLLDAIRGIAYGIEHLHSHDIIHGDLKASNILMADDGSPVVADFGLSKILEHSTGYTTSSLAGSLNWLAPELFEAQELGQPIQTSRSGASDIWALGCTVYELLTGSIPYADQPNSPVLSRHVRNGNNPLLPTDRIIRNNPAIRNLLVSCWAMNPSERPTIAEFIFRLP
ncbi:kinase-like domain-containing protein [Mycena floridula]|nr:kinase-like domain-containing protein [Mycena floridula]